MLERTAACLEPCGVRVFPPCNKTLRSTRQLHTTFWQHGAADIELTKTWQALMHGTLDTTHVSDQTKSSSLSASAFLLDFLYPTGAVALVRRLSPATPRGAYRFRLRAGASHVAPRLYSSSIPRNQMQPSRRSSEDKGDHEATDHDTNNDDQDYALSLSIERDGLEPPISADDGNPVEAIERILQSKDLDQVELLWRHYKSLDEKSQDTYFRPVLALLSRTGRVSDSWKVSELFHKLNVSSWDDDLFVSGVAAEINLQNLTQALSVFEQGLQSTILGDTSLLDTLDLLLAAAFKTSTPDFLENIWKFYPEMVARWDFDDITANLKHVASVSGIAEKAMIFGAYMAERLRDPSSNESDAKPLQVLQKILVRKAILSCRDSQVLSLLDLTKDPLAFQDYLMLAQKQGKTNIATEVYAVYRELPGNVPSHAMLHCAFNAYKGMSGPSSRIIAGIELLWKDWHRFHDVPSRRAYQKHMGFHAARGHKERVYALWAEYIERFRDDPAVDIFDVSEGSDTFAHLLQVHAVNAEPEEAQRIFDEMLQKFKVEPSIYHWNILMNAHVKAGDYDGAIATFDNLCEAVQPDKYSYGTLMQMAGLRGDVGYCVDLYRRARASRVPVNDAMLSSLVDAYCQNDYFKEAADVCERAALNKIRSTRMWNKLLYYHALRRDLASINKLLNKMVEKEIPYNQFTYQQLLLGLTLCRQSHHALQLLTVALQETVFEVTPEHFNIVMGGLLRTGEPSLIRRLCLLMEQRGIPVTEDIMFRLSQALGQWEDLPIYQQTQRSEKKWIGDSLRVFFQIYGYKPGFKAELEPSSRPPRPVRLRELLRSGREVFQFGTMSYIFAQLNDSVRVNELVDLYRYVFQGSLGDDEILPLSMLNAVILSALQDKHYDRVKTTWILLFDGAKRAARSIDHLRNLPHNSKISPRFRYSLSSGLRVMQEVLFREGDAFGLQKLIEDVIDAGFEVDSKNWNYHIQVLVQMKEHKTAFTLCERMLMPNWTGWYVVRVKEAVRNAISLHDRRKGSSPRHLRPTATTLYRLAQAYLELDRISLWSDEAASTLREVDKDCVQVVRAIKSMVRVHSTLEAEIFGLPEFTDTVDIDVPMVENAMPTPGSEP
ncbi:hypothetical protein GGS21DRAFT_219342 [Xylaria nigripes]|nr:hypothetical protein GGS21DRAFT_219342 [Xylaria nigripes]